MKTLHALALATCLAFAAAPAGADLIHSTFPWSTGGGWAIAGPQEPLGVTENDVAFFFRVPPGTSYDHILVDLPLDNVWGTTMTEIMIMDSDWSLYPPRPGSVLGLRTVNAPSSGAVVRVIFPDTLLLRADSTYWVAASTPSNGFQGWPWSTNVLDARRSYRLRSSGWTTEMGQACGFEVYGSPSVTGIPPAGAGATALSVRPNPSAGEAVFTYRLDEPAAVTLRVFDVRGRLVRTCAGGETQGPGEHRVAWDGADANGVRVAPGVYFAQLGAGNLARTRRVVRLD